MGSTEAQIIGGAVRLRLVRLVRGHAGVFPGEKLLDLHSPGAFLATGLARESPRWTVFSPDPPDQPAPNLARVTLRLPTLPFEDGTLAATVGAFLDHPFTAWSPKFASELRRVLLPRGRVLLLARTPTSQVPGLRRTLPPEATEHLKAAGFTKVGEERLLYLLDGSQVVLVDGTVPL